MAFHSGQHNPAGDRKRTWERWDRSADTAQGDTGSGHSKWAGGSGGRVDGTPAPAPARAPRCSPSPRLTGSERHTFITSHSWVSVPGRGSPRVTPRVERAVLITYIFFFFLPFPASRCHWISQLVVSSLIFEFGPHHIPPTIATGLVSPRDGAGKGVLLFRTHVMTLSPPGPSRMLPPPRGHSLASVTFSLFPT